MPGTTDKIKGRAKVAAGAVTGDRTLENEGRVDRLAGLAKDTLADVTNTLEKWLGSASDQAAEALRSGQRKVEDLLNARRS